MKEDQKAVSSVLQLPGFGSGIFDLFFIFLVTQSHITKTMIIDIGVPTRIHSKNDISTPLIVS